MIKRTIEISSAAAHLTTRHRQLVLQRDGQTIGSFPCEDVGVIVIDHPGTTYSHAALSSLVESDAVMVVCGRDHLPSGILIPLSDHSQVVWRLHDQISVGKATVKRLWRQLVRAKIRAQAENLEAGSPGRRRLMELAREVRAGDPENAESQAARVYWGAWLLTPDHEPPETRFRRNPDEPGLNALLNYGYAILRAALARALVAAGLLPAVGIKHSNRSNTFCLADDLIEPLRPIVDARARELYWSGQQDLDQPTKAALLELLAGDVSIGGKSGPLMVAMHTMVASLVACYEGNSKLLEIPTRCRSADTGVCGS